MVADDALAPQEPANENTPADQDTLDISALAKGVLARSFRPRAVTVRRLAEAVLSLQGELRSAKKPGKKAAKGKNSPDKVSGKGSKKKRKLAKIPGQKGA